MLGEPEFKFFINNLQNSIINTPFRKCSPAREGFAYHHRGRRCYATSSAAPRDSGGDHPRRL